MRSHKLYKLMVLLLLSGLLLTACGSSGTATPAGSDLLGKTWLWQKTSFNGGSDVTPLKPANYTLQFLANGKVEITADCNSGSGNYSTPNGVNLTIQIETLTQAVCPTGSRSDEYIRELNNSVSYSIQRNGELVIGLQSGGGMRFAAQ